jgi:HTH-type transcriptional regulator/antitoxin HigA
MVTDGTDRTFSNLAIPPGELLAEELEARGMSQRELAERTGRPEQAISGIINGRKSITHDTALELEKVLGVAADFWANLESSYQLTKARLREKDELETQDDWLDFFPVKELQAREYLPKTSDKAEILAGLLRFFGVASFPALRQHQVALLQHYRITPGSVVNEGALWAWLRIGDIEGQEIETAPYNEQQFIEVLREIRSLLGEHPTKSLPKVKELCASAGVAFVVVKQFPKSGANGVTRWLTPEKALVQLSTKRRWLDVFWFSFYHEAKHVIDRHKKRVLVNKLNVDPAEEDAADRFAEDMLIPRDQWQDFVNSGRYRSYQDVSLFAQSVGIHPCIVVGRLHNEGLVPSSHLNDLRPRLVWPDDKA